MHNEFLVKDKMSYGSNYQPKLKILIVMKKKIDYVGLNGLQLVKYVRLVYWLNDRNNVFYFLSTLHV